MNGRRRWAGWALVAYGSAAVLVLVLPVGYASVVQAIAGAVHRIPGVDIGNGWIEFAANVLLFGPLGFLLALLFRHPWWGTALAIALSAAAELGQIVIPSRVASLRDVLANALGAVIGAAVAWLLVLRRERRRARSTPPLSRARPQGTRRAR